MERYEERDGERKGEKMEEAIIINGPKKGMSEKKKNTFFVGLENKH